MFPGMESYNKTIGALPPIGQMAVMAPIGAAAAYFGAPWDRWWHPW